MAEIQEKLENPFSPEKAWLTYRKNMETARQLREEILRETGTERERLLKAADALGRLTDNTILEKVVRKALEERDAS